jgi:hypothetical protein
MELKMSHVQSGYAGTFEGEGFPSNPTKKAVSVGLAIWNWSPGNMREDEYILDHSDGFWFLWLSYFDDNEEQTQNGIVGFMPDVGVAADVAAASLISSFWAFDQELGEPGGFDDAFFNDPVVNVDMFEIAGKIWSEIPSQGLPESL